MLALTESMEQTNKKHVDTISTLRSEHQEQWKQLEREKCDVEFLVNEKVRMFKNKNQVYLGCISCIRYWVGTR